MGDPAGIGPEIVIAAAARPRVRRSCSLVVFGDRGLLEAARRSTGVSRKEPSAISSVEEITRFLRGRPRPGRRAGSAAFAYLDAAARATAEGRYDALVTAPINKYWMQRAGHAYDGHTGYLSDLTGVPATMMLAGSRLRVVLATTHIALAAVPAALTGARIRRVTLAAHDHLRRYHGLRRPKLAIAALNPHAGEGGLFGDEEKRVIAPAVRALARRGLNVRGPLPADTLFAAAAAGDYDAVVCMYHDQALIPLKLLEFGRSVNVSMGLPFIRTSPDHGTAYDLAGTGKASEESMAAAILEAATMSTAGKARRKR
jgi:4-hydroxythreonine-4-phosphate dehydrogenase